MVTLTVFTSYVVIKSHPLIFAVHYSTKYGQSRGTSLLPVFTHSRIFNHLESRPRTRGHIIWASRVTARSAMRLAGKTAGMPHAGDNAGNAATSHNPSQSRNIAQALHQTPRVSYHACAALLRRHIRPISRNALVVAEEHFELDLPSVFDQAWLLNGYLMTAS